MLLVWLCAKETGVSTNFVWSLEFYKCLPHINFKCFEIILIVTNFFFSFWCKTVCMVTRCDPLLALNLFCYPKTVAVNTLRCLTHQTFPLAKRLQRPLTYHVSF